MRVKFLLRALSSTDANFLPRDHLAFRRIMNRHLDLKDKSDSFSWISIALHWVTAMVVLTMWFIGQSIYSQSSLESIDAVRNLHITIGLLSWVLIAGRIAWRIRNGHPRVAGQTLRTHRIARLTHYLMLVLLGVLIITGPLMAWLGSWESPLFSLLHTVHQITANVLFALIILHILASLKHLMFHEDETIIRIFMPKK